MSETDLEGATTPPAPNSYAANAGEFAARWNAYSPEVRDEWVHRMVENSQASLHCFQAHPQGYIEHLQSVIRDMEDKQADHDKEVARQAASRAWNEAIDHVEPSLSPALKRAAHKDNPYDKRNPA